MVKYEIIWFSEANQNLEQIYLYIAYHLREPVIAQKIYSKIKSTVLSLRCFPERYPDLSHYGITNKKYRRLRVGKIIILYRIDYFNRQSVYLAHISFKAKLFESNVN